MRSAKLDSSYLNSTVATHASGLKVLPGPREIEDSEEVTPTRLRTVLRQLRGIYDHLVIDTPSVFNETTIEALDHSDAVLLVAMLNIPSVRNAKRIRAAFDRLGYPAATVGRSSYGRTFTVYSGLRRSFSGIDANGCDGSGHDRG